MIAFLTLCYLGMVYLVFVKLKLLPWNKGSQSAVAVVGIVAIFLLIVAMGLFQPYSTVATVSKQVIPIVARVDGRVLEVAVETNQHVNEGDVLLRLDARPYQAKVDQLEASLAEATQNVPRLKAALDAAVARREFARLETERLEQAAQTAAVSQADVDRARAQYDASVADAESARLAYEAQIGGVNTQVAQIEAQLDKARIDLAECTLYAPANGRITQLFVRPGAVTRTLQFSSVMSFVYEGEGGSMVRALFPARALKYVRAGDPVEVVLDTMPGGVLDGTVIGLALATSEGALTPSGELLSIGDFARKSEMIAVQIRLEDDLDDPLVPAGTGGVAAIYTDRAKAIRVVRKVVVRMAAWTAYL